MTSKVRPPGLLGVHRQELELEGVSNVHVCTVFPGSVDTPICGHAANYTGREVGLVPPIADPDGVVRAILSCVSRPRPEVLVGRGTTLLALGQALAPALMRRVLPPMFARLVLGKRGVERTAGNVLESMPELNRVRRGS